MRGDRIKRLVFPIIDDESKYPELGSGSAATWDKLVEIDPDELLKRRLEQKVYLARYARQDLFGWEHRDVTELKAYHDALSELVRGENELSRAKENT